MLSKILIAFVASPHQIFINGYQDIAFGNFDAILLIFMSSVVTSQMNTEKMHFHPKHTYSAVKTMFIRLHDVFSLK